MLGRNGVRIAGVDGNAEPAEVGLDRRAVAQVLEPLAGGDLDALLLLLDVRHYAPGVLIGTHETPAEGGRHPGI